MEPKERPQSVKGVIMAPLAFFWRCHRYASNASHVVERFIML